MADPLRLLLSLTLSGGILTLFIALLCRALRGRVPAVLVALLWLAALARFLIPLGAEWNLTAQILTPPEEAAHSAPSEPSGDASAVQIPAPPAQTLPPSVETPVHAAPEPDFPVETPAPARKGPDAASILLALWAIGVLLCAAVFLVSAAGFRRELRRRELAAGEDAEDACRSAAEELGIGCPMIRRSAAIPGPMLEGLIRPTVWLPASCPEGEELRLALMHELTHLRRRDLWYKRVALVNACLHWFNPAAWYLLRAVGRDCELACDETVALRLTDREKPVYGELLLRGAAKNRQNSTLFMPFGNSKKIMKERLTIIMRKNPDSRSSRSLAALCAAAALILGAVLGSCGYVSASGRDAEKGTEKTGDTQTDESGAINFDALEEMNLNAVDTVSSGSSAAAIVWDGQRQTVYITLDSGATWTEDLPEPGYEGGEAEAEYTRGGTGIFPVCGLENGAAALYRVELTGRSLGLVRWEDRLMFADMEFVESQRVAESRLTLADLDGDGEEELAAAVANAVGSGVDCFDLYVFERDGGAAALRWQDAAALLEENLSGSFDPETCVYTVALSGRAWELDLSADAQWLADSPIGDGGLDASGSVTADLEELVLSVVLRPEGMPAYDLAALAVPVAYSGSALTPDISAAALEPLSGPARETSPIQLESYIDALKEVLRGEKDFYCRSSEGESVGEANVGSIEKALTPDPVSKGEVNGFTVLDMDGDGAVEAVLSVYYGGYEQASVVLRCTADGVEGIRVWSRSFSGLKTDGTFESSSGADNAEIRVLRGGEVQTLWSRDGAYDENGSFLGWEYRKGGEKCAEEEFQAALALQSSKPAAQYYDLTPENINQIK